MPLLMAVSTGGHDEGQVAALLTGWTQSHRIASSFQCLFGPITQTHLKQKVYERHDHAQRR